MERQDPLREAVTGGHPGPQEAHLLATAPTLPQLGHHLKTKALANQVLSRGGFLAGTVPHPQDLHLAED